MADLQRLENLGLFAETRVVPEADGDGVRLDRHRQEMPPILAFPSFIYTEENGFSYGAALSALNLTGRGMSLSARAYFGGTTQRWARFVRSLDPRQPRLLRVLRRQAGSRGHPQRLRGGQLGVLPEARAPGSASTAGCKDRCRSSRCRATWTARPWTRTTTTISCAWARSSGTTRAIRGGTPGTAGRTSSRSSAAAAPAPSGR